MSDVSESRHGFQLLPARTAAAVWQRLAELLDRVDSKGLHGLNPREADELFSLYRLTSSDLNLVQTRTANPSLVRLPRGAGGRA